jgi:hypothetical protein
MLPGVYNDYEAHTMEPGDTSAYYKFLVGSTGAISTVSRASGCFGTAVRLDVGKYYYPLTAAFYSAPILPGGIKASPLLDIKPTVHGAYSTTTGTIGFVLANTSSGSNQRTIAHGTDSVVASTKTFTFSNGAFTFDDIGSTLTLGGTANGNNGTYTIKSVTSGTVVVVVETVTADETFGSGVTQSISGIGIAVQFNQAGDGTVAEVATSNLVMLSVKLKRNP